MSEISIKSAVNSECCSSFLWGYNSWLVTDGGLLYFRYMQMLLPIRTITFHWRLEGSGIFKNFFRTALFKRAGLIVSQWTFWYCNNIWSDITLDITLWHCWYVGNKTHDDVNLRYQPDIRILRLNQSDFNFVLTSSRQRALSSRKKSSKIVYHFSISHNLAKFIFWQLKNQSFRRLFFQLLQWKICNIFSKQCYST